MAPYKRPTLNYLKFILFKALMWNNSYVCMKLFLMRNAQRFRDRLDWVENFRQFSILSDLKHINENFI